MGIRRGLSSATPAVFLMRIIDVQEGSLGPCTAILMLPCSCARQACFVGASLKLASSACKQVVPALWMQLNTCFTGHACALCLREGGQWNCSLTFIQSAPFCRTVRHDYGAVQLRSTCTIVAAASYECTEDDNLLVCRTTQEGICSLKHHIHIVSYMCYADCMRLQAAAMLICNCPSGACA